MYRPDRQEKKFTLRVQRHLARPGVRRSELWLSRWLSAERWVGLLVVLLLAGFVVGRQGLLDLWRFKTQQTALDTRIHELKMKNTELERQIDSLKKTDAQIERVARERMDMIRDNEYLYKFIPKKTSR